MEKTTTMLTIFSEIVQKTDKKIIQISDEININTTSGALDILGGKDKILKMNMTSDINKGNINIRNFDISRDSTLLHKIIDIYEPAVIYIDPIYDLTTDNWEFTQ